MLGLELVEIAEIGGAVGSARSSGDRRDEAKYAADGILGFSATCTHQQCPVAEWLSELQLFQCPCHQSRFDPKHGAQVVGGQAPRPLPRLPLVIANDALQVAGPFIGRVGGQQPGTG
jgi:rieske iron-sulfur protein